MNTHCAIHDKIHSNLHLLINFDISKISSVFIDLTYFTCYETTKFNSQNNDVQIVK